MAKRKNISKKIRFEIFKRDKFKCQYCGGSAPDIILNVDHIDPVANGGTNELTNLITSCFDCNQGKKARLLSDDSIVQKQRNQLQLVQERREQLLLMLKWKKSLDNIENEEIKIIEEYWNSLFEPYYVVDENTVNKIKSFLKENKFDKILTAIKKSEKYIIYDDGIPTFDSVNNSINKVYGIIINEKLPEGARKIKYEIAYIKGICRNRFDDFNKDLFYLTINSYISALKTQGYSEWEILNDLKKDVRTLSKSKEYFKWWNSTIEDWVDQIYKWDNEN